MFYRSQGPKWTTTQAMGLLFQRICGPHSQGLKVLGFYILEFTGVRLYAQEVNSLCDIRSPGVHDLPSVSLDSQVLGVLSTNCKKIQNEMIQHISHHGPSRLSFNIYTHLYYNINLYMRSIHLNCIYRQGQVTVWWPE